MRYTDTFAKELVEKMTLDQKVGAVLTLGFAGVVPKPYIYDFIEKYHCGGLRLSCDMRTFGSYVDPKSGKTVVDVERQTGIKYKQTAPTCTAGEYAAVLADLQMAARKRSLSIPLHFSFDQEGGSSADFCFGGVNIFPKPMGLTATGDKELTYKAALETARQSRAVGFNWVHSPVLDICSEPRNPEIYTRSYSDDPAVVADYAAATCRGLRDGGVIATGKHFPGRGHSCQDAHFGVPVIDVDRETMERRELRPYRALIAQGLLPSIMIAHSIFPAIDPDNIATVSRKVITGLLREELGFEGVITTDSMTMGAIATRYGVANACAMALAAGADLVLMKAENELVGETVDTIKAFVADGRLPIEELNDKVYRILALKHQYGLFEEPDAARDPEREVRDPAVKALAAEIARKSILVARDADKLLPLPTDKKILVVEQKVKEYNDMQWHSGILYEACMRQSRHVDYQETAYSYDDADKTAIMARARDYDLLVITSYFLRGKLSNREWLEGFLADCKTPAVIVTNTPFEEISIPKNARNVVITFATSPANVKATAEVLFGKCEAEGKMPVKNGISVSAEAMV